MKSVILHELEHHAPFTFFGALSGIVLMIFFHSMPHKTAYTVFYIFHPIHVFLSALITASMYKNYKCETGKKECNIAVLLTIGFVGSIGVATLSDSIMPFLGELLIGLPNAKPHLGFMEEGWVILGCAAAGIAAAYFRPSTKFPHSAHVLISTWASLFHIIMALGKTVSVFAYIAILLFLFIAVWVPCCVSDIIFPLLFIGKDAKPLIHKH